ncbi:hypothetical protein P152DRAFT_462221 [Eremomyces bilateralis CBS 781.70]|uniref:HNH nuclease domain-containing protein n=1 Tax=Eremomyces bilateralis CBS 781.70 TaxID=1392243 RepID=A0A6G1FSK1_9PEZI|nr:uncharacterized protein P152DRAFT_462221 [Eremomyces bilateralis CBS 781.70]KAF1808661.1 hypothetical protein P152DRAFT_462221 [Eremomyces bilateralis CBS 781.70]
MSSPSSPISDRPLNSSNPSNPPQTSTMVPRDRSEGRDVHVYDANDSTTVLGGLVLTNGVTNSNFYSMVDILVLFTSCFELQHEETKVERNDDPLQPGKYYIIAAGPFSVNNEPWLLRTISHSTGTRTDSFRNAIRSRDRRCVISGQKAVGAYRNNWRGFEAAHVFPLAYEGDWTQHGYDRWITIPPEKGGTINSVQNGMLLRTDIHQLFDSYDLSIDPDDNYKIVFFSDDGAGLAGKCLDQEFRNNPQRPVDPLLRWHFRQAVLANMRGAGEPQFEHDFPPGSDMVGDILNGPKAAERMEFELFNRLAA